ncbi:MAG: Flavin-dependent monooxygenase, reductase subunit HsaB [Gemmatimonadaceae bacterium]|nr:Flavin-dependent monooxygenase, reductase subunit HsaB [Gemmatimonadaceae bacterium]
MIIDPDLYRSVLGRFASGVTVLTTRDAGGRDHGMTVNAFAALSLAPPLVVACIDRAATMHDVLEQTGFFTVNILASPQEALSRRFSDLDASQRFDGIGFTRGRRGAPILDDVLAMLECTLVQRFDGGDHSLFIGQVETARIDELRPLLYYRGGYAQLER